MSARWARTTGFALVLFLGAATLVADEVPAHVVAAFQRYVDATEARMLRDRADHRLLWIDRLPAARRTGVERRLALGEVVTQSPRTEVQGTSLTVRGAIFLHSVAVVFLPGATLPATLSVLQDFDHHAEVFSPTVRKSKVVGRRGDAIVVAGQFSHKKVFTIVYNAETEWRCMSLDTLRSECRSISTRGAMVAHAGRPTEREKPFRGDPRKQWFLRTYYRVEERSAGTFVEHETLFVSPQLSPLTRVFTPLVRDVPAEVSRAFLVKLRRRLSLGPTTTAPTELPKVSSIGSVRAGPMTRAPGPRESPAPRP